MSRPDAAFQAQVTAELRQFEAELGRLAVAESPFVTEAAAHVLDAGGKRLRPLLVLLCAHLGSDIDLDRLLAAACVMELTHVASLYHDDVMDEATIRRGVASANVRYGNQVAILVGDFLFSQASAQVARLGVDYVQRQAETFARMVQGQIAETRGPSDGVDAMVHYLSVLSDKTAALIATSAVFGGMVGGLPRPTLDVLLRFGEELGMVFQLSDDLLDVTSEVAGKRPGTDLREGVATLPVLLLRTTGQAADAALYDRIVAGLTDPEVSEVLATLRVHPVIGLAQAEITRRSELVRELAEQLPDAPARDALFQLVAGVANRIK